VTAPESADPRAVSEGPPAAESEPEARPVRRRRKRTHFKIPEHTAIAVRPLWEQASDEERQRAHRYAMAILESWVGRASWDETAERLGLPPVRVHQLSQQAVSGMLAGLLKQPRRRRKVVPSADPVAPEDDPVRLRKRIGELEAKLARTEDLVRVLQEFPWHRAGAVGANKDRKKEVASGRKPVRRKPRGRSAAGPRAEHGTEEGGGAASGGAAAPRA